ncbi:MAG: ferric reductase-like transmembrane domain-containing protein [Acidimicrobiales bacterium]|nr:ferric reductase-like transmembrane domain-containing protein [Acidimicrobiales bacterium]
MNEQLWWYVARSGGILAWVIVTLSVLWGLALSTKVLGRRGAPAWLLDIHRWFAALSIVFTAVHVLALVADSYIYFGWSELFVPMASTYEPAAVAWGIVAFYLMVAIQITSLVMRKLPRKVWRYVHFTSFLVFALATYHGQAAGTDATNGVYRWTGLVLVQLVLFLLIVRLAAQRRFRKRTGGRPRAGVIATIL